MWGELPDLRHVKNDCDKAEVQRAQSVAVSTRTLREILTWIDKRPDVSDRIEDLERERDEAQDEAEDLRKEVNDAEAEIKELKKKVFVGSGAK